MWISKGTRKKKILAVPLTKHRIPAGDICRKCHWVVTRSNKTGDARPGSNPVVCGRFRRIENNDRPFARPVCCNAQFDSQQGSCAQPMNSVLKLLQGNKKKTKKTQRSLCRLRRHRSSHVGPHGPLRTSPYQIWINHRMRQPLHFNSSIFMACLPLAYTHAHTQYPSTPSHAAICISPKTFKHNEYLRWNIIMLDRMGSKTPNTRLTFFFKVWTSPTYQKLMGSNLGRDPPSIQLLADKPINRREAHRWQHNLPGGGKKK